MTVIPRAKFESRYKLANFVMDGANGQKPGISSPGLESRSETTDRARDFVTDHFHQEINVELNRRLAEATKRGLAEGAAHGREKYLDQIAILVKELEQQGKHLTSQLTGIVAEAVRVAFGQLDPADAPRAAVEQVLSRQGYSENVSVMICPADVTALQAYCRGRTKATGAAGWRVVADPNLLPGEVIVDSILGRVHVGLTAQANHTAEMISGILE